MFSLACVMFTIKTFSEAHPDGNVASVALVQMQATTKRITREEEPINSCSDVVGWTNARNSSHPVHLPCSAYDKKYCNGGAPRAGSEWTIGPHYNWPEVNCCSCGRNTDCHDTPGWVNHPVLKRTCAHYRAKFCQDGQMIASYDAFGAKFNFPEKNCCACGADAHEETETEKYSKLVGRCQQWSDLRYWCPGDDKVCGGAGQTSRMDIAAASSLEGCQRRCDKMRKCAGIAFGNAVDGQPDHCITYMNSCVDSGKHVEGSGYTHYFKRASPYYHLRGHCQENSIEPMTWCTEDRDCGELSQSDPYASDSPSECQKRCDTTVTEGGACTAWSWGRHPIHNVDLCTTYEGACIDSNDGDDQKQFFAKKRYHIMNGHCRIFGTYVTWCPEQHRNCGGDDSISFVSEDAARDQESCRQKCDSMGSTCVAYRWGNSGGQDPFHCRTFTGKCVDSMDNNNKGFVYEKKVFLPYVPLKGHCTGFKKKTVFCPKSKPSCGGADSVINDYAVTSGYTCQKSCNEIGSDCVAVAWRKDKCEAILETCVDSNDFVSNGFDWYRPPYIV